MELLETVKKSLLIPISETYADDELNNHISACKNLLVSTGITSTVVENHPLAHSLVVIYCKTFFGFKADGSVKDLPKSFDMLLNQLALSSGDYHVSE